MTLNFSPWAVVKCEVNLRAVRSKLCILCKGCYLRFWSCLLREDWSIVCVTCRRLLQCLTCWTTTSLVNVWTSRITRTLAFVAGKLVHGSLKKYALPHYSYIACNMFLVFFVNEFSIATAGYDTVVTLWPKLQVCGLAFNTCCWNFGAIKLFFLLYKIEYIFENEKFLYWWYYTVLYLFKYCTICVI